MRKEKTAFRDVYRDHNGKIFYQVYLGRDAITGKKISKKGRKSLSGRPFRTEHQAYKTMINIKNRYLERNGRANYRIHFDNFVKDKYLPKYKGDVENSTFRTHLHIFHIIVQKIGHKLLTDLKVPDCERFRTWLLTKSGFSKSYCSMVYITFRQILNYATLIGLIDNNPSLKTKSISKGKSIVHYWTKEDFEKVLSCIYTGTFYGYMSFIIIWLYYMTGVRVSEGLALKWEDVDLEDHKLRVFHTLDMINQHNYKVKNYTKTFSGKRTITLDDDTVRYLKKWRRIQRHHGVNNFVLSYDDQPLYRLTVNRIVKRYAKQAHVPEIQAKGLRHSHVSYLINEFNANVLIVSRRLGHSSPDVTLKYYSHLWDHSDDGLAKEMTGNIHFNSAKTHEIKFHGNRNIRPELAGYNSAKSLPKSKKFKNK